MQISHMDLRVLYNLLSAQQQEICDLSERLLRTEQEVYQLRAAQNGRAEDVSDDSVEPRHGR